jgi:hypothetical protein
MTTHWLHVTLGWAATLGLFATLAVAAAMRVRDARRDLARLETRGRDR